MWQDQLNGMLELLGAPFILLSIINLAKSKTVSGVSWIHVCFFSFWGLWNLYYYPHLNQWWSFYGGLALVFTNLIWLGQIVYYLTKEKQNKSFDKTKSKATLPVFPVHLIYESHEVKTDMKIENGEINYYSHSIVYNRDGSIKYTTKPIQISTVRHTCADINKTPS